MLLLTEMRLQRVVRISLISAVLLCMFPCVSLVVRCMHLKDLCVSISMISQENSHLFVRKIKVMFSV